MWMRIWLISALSAIGLSTGSAAADPRPELKTVKGTGTTYYVGLPTGWTPDKTWPILVAIDGSGHDFQGYARNFMKASEGRGFIVVAPCVVNNGKDPADLDAVLACVKDVRLNYQGREKFFITGFSAGGHVTWQLILKHPERLAGAAPAAANFRFRHVEPVSKAKERIQLPVRGFNGGKDSPAINSQWDDAAKFAAEHGFKNLTHRLIPNAGHQPFAGEVVKFFAEIETK